MNYSYILAAAFEKRSPLFSDEQTNCFRLFNGSGDGLRGISIDIYDAYIVVQYFREDHLEDGALKKTFVSQLITELQKLPVSIKGIFIKNRLSYKDPRIIQQLRRSVLLEGAAPEGDLIVLQNGIKAKADLLEGQNTGVFLDMREVREELVAENLYTGSMLNLFCYTGLFSVHGLVNGADSAVNVDLSKGVLARARDNYLLNSLSCDDRDFIHADVWDRLKLYNKKSAHFDFIVFDPPTFSRNKKKSFSVKRDYTASLKLIESLRPAYVLSSINTLSVTLDEYTGYHPPSWECVRLFHESSDFPCEETPYLKTGLWRMKSV